MLNKALYAALMMGKTDYTREIQIMFDAIKSCLMLSNHQWLSRRITPGEFWNKLVFVNSISSTRTKKYHKESFTSSMLKICLKTAVCFPTKSSFVSSIFMVLGSVRILILRVKEIICLTHFVITLPFSLVSSISLALDSLGILILQVQVIIRSMHFAISFSFSFVSSVFFALSVLEYWFYRYKWSFVQCTSPFLFLFLLSHQFFRY